MIFHTTSSASKTFALQFFIGLRSLEFIKRLDGFWEASEPRLCWEKVDDHTIFCGFSFCQFSMGLSWLIDYGLKASSLFRVEKPFLSFKQEKSQVQLSKTQKPLIKDYSLPRSDTLFLFNSIAKILCFRLWFCLVWLHILKLLNGMA